MADQKGDYAKAGVDYTKIQPFKEAMIGVGRRTASFPEARQVFIDTDLAHAHGGVFEYEGSHRHAWCKTQEGLGNESWISELMYLRNPSDPSVFESDAYDNAMMAVNDCIAQGAMPVAYTDEVAASDSGWFEDPRRAGAIAAGFYDACEDAGMALVAGESPVYKYLINPSPPVRSAAVFGGCVTGIIAPGSRKITGKKLAPGDHIIGGTSSGIHSNGYSSVIRRVMGDPNDGILALPDGFDTKLPSGMTIGEAVHIPTRCYVRLVERLLDEEVDIHAILPGTGDGVGKLSFDKRPYQYLVHSWPKVPELFLCMQELGVPFKDCLKTFNWGVGFYLFVPAREVDRVLNIAELTGYEALDLGLVKEGERGTVFGPANDLFLEPPGT